jgi:abelson tyrosine-protein kinase 1
VTKFFIKLPNAMLASVRVLAFSVYAHPHFTFVPLHLISIAYVQLSIQIRILKQVQKAELQRQIDTQALLKSLLDAGGGVHPEVYTRDDASLLLSPVPEGIPHTSDVYSNLSNIPPPPYIQPYAASSTAVLDADALASADPAHVRSALRALHARQNQIDQARDTVDLRSLMRVALQASSDADMINVLQVGRDEMPEAIKTLQRALEKEVERESLGPGDGVGTSVGGAGEMVVRRVSVKEVAVPVAPAAMSEGQGPDADAPIVSRRQTLVSIESDSSGSAGSAVRDTLDREFIESGIDALRRMSQGVGVELPSWTITRFAFYLSSFPIKRLMLVV